ncbi:glycosyl-4,4'-diaponeurosporenoate acyltransferase [Staphylococcus nepalensis]|uniref:Glycosyl-4,4'-diaponeurosporenoate acyltransferase n=1 Tax=Staphylococcus nepalensis TaxID=214473 RepID=A0ABS3L3X0_9STAP|nr:glycosyl-4,4'-diaponeurosporenoate acyltransferase [Staphylococcus nepalensis]MBO1212233.1 glycosyl-4,4'-diaponeurosporenoate acyltransferase [Staphylococcus nepalensis]MBO1217356.1 glycosyl-4,4'-diaponeurosporenoate acyltransferase [Staphylococcus nepalensis]MBO1227710.1 glycosyl-4,4'-diaponeurosporenoate acyltransferase [Staphylococcus nepalensis]MBO1235392.1 glycosyl-4,4'-diaponeurosporenoate acyltransferase [Staphylococcus nepalensis]MBO1236631.1 glycosyl-4,4'-diaponeurosporenoate acylt
MKKIIYNALYWFVIQMIIAQLGTYISRKCLENGHIYFKSWPIEQEGQLWQKVVKVQYWKNHLPDGQRINSTIISKSNFDKSSHADEVRQFILETRRAEFVHLLSIVPVIVFAKSSSSVKMINLVYVVIANVPCIIVQRYNRPKLERVYLRKLKRKGV